MVLRISQHAVNDSVLAVKVTLAAIGSTKQLAAAIRLPQIKFEDVKGVSIEEGTRFDQGYSTDRYFITNDVATNAFDGSTVINLFEDAHWCVNSKESMGQVVRMRYNTYKFDVVDEAARVPVISRTYRVHMKSKINAYYLSLADIDPFLITSANSGMCVEVHTYKHKYDEVVWHYTNGPGEQDDRVPWALMVPDATFHYPVEGITLGMYRDGQISGAYSRYNHSFGQWGRNRNNSTDWWLYENATKAQVY
jgi:LruC domain-containing protein